MIRNAAHEVIELVPRLLVRAGAIGEVAANLGVAVQREKIVEIAGVQVPQEQAPGFDDDHAAFSHPDP
jgi:hypothetical protein